MTKKEFEELVKKGTDVFPYMGNNGVERNIVFVEGIPYVLEDNKVRQIRKCKRMEKNGVLSINDGKVSGIPLSPKNQDLIERVELYTEGQKSDTEEETKESRQKLVSALSSVSSKKLSPEEDHFVNLAVKLEVWKWTNGENGLDYLQKAIDSGKFWDANSNNSAEQNQVIEEINGIIKNNLLKTLDLAIQDSAYYYMKKNAVSKKDANKAAQKLVDEAIAKYEKRMGFEVKSRLTKDEIALLQGSALLEMDLYNAVDNSHSAYVDRVIKNEIIKNRDTYATLSSSYMMPEEKAIWDLAQKIEDWGWTNGQKGIDYLVSAVENQEPWKEESRNTPEQNEAIRQVNQLIDEIKKNQIQENVSHEEEQQTTPYIPAASNEDATSSQDVPMQYQFGGQPVQNVTPYIPEDYYANDEDATNDQENGLTTDEEPVVEENENTSAPQPKKKTPSKVGAFIKKHAVALVLAAVAVVAGVTGTLIVKGCVDKNNNKPTPTQTVIDLNSEESKQAFVEEINGRKDFKGPKIEKDAKVEVSVVPGKSYNVTTTTDMTAAKVASTPYSVANESVSDNEMVVEYTLSTAKTSPASLSELKQNISGADLSYEITQDPTKDPVKPNEKFDLVKYLGTADAKATVQATLENLGFTIEDGSSISLEKSNTGLTATVVTPQGASDVYEINADLSKANSADAVNSVLVNLKKDDVVLKAKEEDIVTVINSTAWLSSAKNTVTALNKVAANDKNISAIVLNGNTVYAQSSNGETLYEIALNGSVNEKGEYTDANGNVVAINRTSNSANAIFSGAKLANTYQSVEKMTRPIAGAYEMIESKTYAPYVKENGLESVKAYVKTTISKNIVGEEAVASMNVSTVFVGKKGNQTVVEAKKPVSVKNNAGAIDPSMATFVAVSGRIDGTTYEIVNSNKAENTMDMVH